MKKNLTQYLFAATFALVVVNPLHAMDLSDLEWAIARAVPVPMGISAVKNPISTAFVGFSSAVAGIGLGCKAADLGDKSAKALIRLIGLSKDPNLLKRIAAVIIHTSWNFAYASTLLGADVAALAGLLANKEFITNNPMFSTGAITASGLFAITLPIATLRKCIAYVRNNQTEAQTAAA